MISVVMCTFNGETFVREQLESILRQSRRPEAIILSDDGSRDNTLAVARDVLSSPAASGIELTILTRETALGPAGNFSEALGHARPGFVALADQDDVWHPEKLEVLTSLLETESDCLAIHTDAAIVNRDGRRYGSLMRTLSLTGAESSALLRGQGRDALLKRNLATGATMMVRTELLERALPIPPGWVHDEWLAMVAALSGGLRFDPRELIDYRQHGGNDIGARPLGPTEATRRLRESRGDFFARKELRNDALLALVTEPPTWLHGGAREALAGKLEHDRWRSALPERRLLRVAPVIGRWFTGHYARYARGVLDVLRDLSLRA